MNLNGAADSSATRIPLGGLYKLYIYMYKYITIYSCARDLALWPTPRALDRGNWCLRGYYFYRSLRRGFVTPRHLPLSHIPSLLAQAVFCYGIQSTR